MSNTIEAIRGLLNLPRLQKFYAEAKLDDGRVIVTEAESMEVGAEVRVMSDDGSAQELESGSYTLEDGTAITIEENRIASIGAEEAEPTEAAEHEDKEEMAEHGDKEEEMSKLLASVGLNEEDKEKVMQAIAALYDDKEEMSTEETAQDTAAEIETQLSAFAQEVTGALEHVLDRIEALEKAPASEPVKFSAPQQKTNVSVPGINANYTERARYIMNSLKNN